LYEFHGMLHAMIKIEYDKKMGKGEIAEELMTVKE
jgi:hypothetical protein